MFRLERDIYSGVKKRLFDTAVFSANFADLGSGAVDTTIKGTGTATFTRATAATCWGPTGLLLTVATGVARSTYNELTGANYLGYLSEEARTNKCLWNRDFSQAATWVASNVTALKDQVGIDGAANAASSLLATAGNGTVKQTITVAAVNRPYSVYIKRLVGTGNIDLAQDGTTYTTQTIPSDSAWHRCTLVASQLNPVLSIRIVTNGDKIAVDYAALEDTGGAAATFPTTPIATTTVAVTRNQDVLTYPSAGNVGSTGTIYAEFAQENLSTSWGIMEANDGTTNNRITLNTNANPSCAMGVVAGSVIQANFFGSGTVVANTLGKVAARFAAAGFGLSFNGNAVTTAAAGTIPTVTTLDFSRVSGGTINRNGAIKNVRIWNSVLSDGIIPILTA